MVGHSGVLSTVTSPLNKHSKMVASLPNVCCQGCGEVTDSRLCCPRCSNFGRASFFCSQNCFRRNWAAHNRLHAVMKPSAGLKSVVSMSFLDDDLHSNESLTSSSTFIDINNPSSSMSSHPNPPPTQPHARTPFSSEHCAPEAQAASKSSAASDSLFIKSTLQKEADNPSANRISTGHLPKTTSIANSGEEKSLVTDPVPRTKTDNIAPTVETSVNRKPVTVMESTLSSTTSCDTSSVLLTSVLLTERRVGVPVATPATCRSESSPVLTSTEKEQNSSANFPERRRFLLRLKLSQAWWLLRDIATSLTYCLYKHYRSSKRVLLIPCLLMICVLMFYITYPSLHYGRHGRGPRRSKTEFFDPSGIDQGIAAGTFDKHERVGRPRADAPAPPNNLVNELSSLSATFGHVKRQIAIRGGPAKPRERKAVRPEIVLPKQALKPLETLPEPKIEDVVQQLRLKLAEMERLIQSQNATTQTLNPLEINANTSIHSVPPAGHHDEITAATVAAVKNRATKSQLRSASQQAIVNPMLTISNSSEKQASKGLEKTALQPASGQAQAGVKKPQRERGVVFRVEENKKAPGESLPLVYNSHRHNALDI